MSVRDTFRFFTAAGRHPLDGTVPNVWLHPQVWDIDYLHRRALLRSVRDVAGEIGRAGTLLDIGCGWMPYASLFDVSRYVGVDTMAHGSVPLRLIEKDGRIPVGDGEADVCTSWQVLEHVGDLDLFFAELKRCTVPGARVYATTHGMFRTHADEDYWRWTKAGLLRLFESHGFREIDVREVDDGVAAAVCSVNFLLAESLCPSSGRSRKLAMLMLAPLFAFRNLIGLALSALAGRRKETVRREASTFIVRCRVPPGD